MADAKARIWLWLPYLCRILSKVANLRPESLQQSNAPPTSGSLPLLTEAGRLTRRGPRARNLLSCSRLSLSPHSFIRIHKNFSSLSESSCKNEKKWSAGTNRIDLINAGAFLSDKMISLTRWFLWQDDSFDKTIPLTKRFVCLTRWFSDKMIPLTRWCLWQNDFFLFDDFFSFYSGNEKYKILSTCMTNYWAAFSPSSNPSQHSKWPTVWGLGTRWSHSLGIGAIGLVD